MALAASDPNDRVDQLVILTERLTDLIAKEASAFENRRPQDAAQYIEETARLANLYRHESARVRANIALISGADAALRQRLVRATEAFDSVLARQARALNAAKTITEGLVRAVAEEIAAQRAPAAGYGAGAMMNNPVASGTAITLNKKA
jgi:hypothetical protein